MAAAETTAAIRALLDGGALLAAKTKVGKREPVDKVGVRAYRHPALGDRVVARLSPEAMAAGDDLEMEFLGFDKPRVTKGVAQQRRRALGFPGWALIHDPKHARYALEVVKELKKHARRARTKPGHAKTGFDEIATVLSRSVPHFLPSFYEEVGRVFLDGGNPGYAAQAFGKARDAERVHALSVDEAQRLQSFLEFALAGAVTNKEVGNYAKDLQKGLDAKSAYAHFRELAVRRTLGGMPPWSGMANELRRLAKAAGLDAAAEDRGFVEEIVEAPALVRAPTDFWTSYEDALIALCQDNSRVRGLLLNLFAHQPPSSWLALLRACGALEALVRQTPPEAAPKGGTAAWMAKTVADLNRGWSHRYPVPEELFALLEETAPRIREEGKPVDLGGQSYYGRTLDLDLCELALTLDVPLRLAEHVRFDLDAWAQLEATPHRHRDPVRVAAHPELGELLAAAVDVSMGGERFDALSTNMAGFRELRRQWLDRCVDGLSQGGLPDVEEALEKLKRSTSARTFVPYPELFDALRAVRVSAALGRTLRGGVFAELCWPALEESAAALAPSRQDLLLFAGAFPHAIVSNEVEVHVVGPNGRELEHTLRLPKKAKLMRLTFVAGELLVIYRDETHATKGYYSSAPQKVLEVGGYHHDAFKMSGFAVTLDDGSVTMGDKAIRAGGDQNPTPAAMLYDGETFWRVNHLDGHPRLYEMDPRTGKLGRASLPKFLEEFVSDDAPLDVMACRLMPLPESCWASPLGARDGMAGWRVRHPQQRGRPEDWVAEGIDGRRFVGQLPHTGSPHAIVAFPGDDAKRLVATGHAYGDYQYALFDSTGAYRLARLSSVANRYTEGAPVVPHILFWHYLQTRDETGSKALRALSDDVANALLDAAMLPNAESPVAERLPDISVEPLREGVWGVVRLAALLAGKLERLIKKRDPANADTTERPVFGDQELMNAVGGLVTTSWSHGDDAIAPLLAAAAFFETGVPVELRDNGVGWTSLLGRDRALAFRAVAAGTSDERRAHLLELLRAWLPFARVRKNLRRLNRVANAGEWPFVGDAKSRTSVCVVHANNRYIGLGKSYSNPRQVELLEYAPDGAFDVGPEASKNRDTFVDPAGVSGETLTQFIELARQRGPVPIDEASIRHITENTGMTRAEAALLWVGLPNFHDYSNNFLDKEMRAALGLKVNEAAAARAALRRLDEDQRAALLEAMFPEDPELLWVPFAGQEDHPATRLVHAFAKVVGSRVAVPQELVTECGRALKDAGDATTMLTWIAAPAAAGPLNRDAKWKLVGGWSFLECDDSQAFQGDTLVHTLAYALHLAETLPVGDAIRDGIPSVVERLRARMRSDDLILMLRADYLEDAKVAEAHLDAFGGDAFTIDKSTRGKQAGAVIALAGAHRVGYALRPALVDDFEDAVIAGLSGGSGPVAWARVLFRSGVDAIVERIQNNPLAAGVFEANPLASVAPLVARVAKEQKLSDDAAVLYLQTLTLKNPTTKWLRQINDWTPARYTKAAKQLAERELVIVAKRARAGRSHFLPGGWEGFSAPLAPIETWKLPLYDISRKPDGQLTMPLSRILAQEPLHVLFERAYERVVSGDAPRYEEVT